MKLELENFGKIKRATLDFNGLTVIVGDNNAGKSTVGKALAALFTIVPEIKGRVIEARMDYVFEVKHNSYGCHYPPEEIKAFLACFENVDLTDQDLVQNLGDLYIRHNIGQHYRLSQPHEQEIRSEAKQAVARLLECRKISDSKLAGIEVGKAFGSWFFGSVKTLGAKRTLLRLTLNDGVNEIVWDEAPHCSFNVPLKSRGWFLGSPLVMNSIGIFHRPDDEPEPLHSMLLDQLTDCQEVNSVSRAIVEEKVRPIEDRLESVLGGRIYYSVQDDELLISGEAYPQPLKVKTLSMGLKAFAVVRWMLEKGVLQEKGVLVLDEPENHLHPQWQLLYAEIIVMLQKCFNLTILLTTHSPYFLESLQLFAKKHGVEDKLNAYQPELDVESRLAVIDRPVADINELYRKFTVPLRELNILRSEMQG